MKKLLREIADPPRNVKEDGHKKTQESKSQQSPCKEVKESGWILIQNKLCLSRGDKQNQKKKTQAGDAEKCSIIVQSPSGKLVTYERLCEKWHRFSIGDNLIQHSASGKTTFFTLDKAEEAKKRCALKKFGKNEKQEAKRKYQSDNARKYQSERQERHESHKAQRRENLQRREEKRQRQAACTPPSKKERARIGKTYNEKGRKNASDGLIPHMPQPVRNVMAQPFTPSMPFLSALSHLAAGGQPFEWCGLPLAAGGGGAGHGAQWAGATRAIGGGARGEGAREDFQYGGPPPWMPHWLPPR